jgi:hypothetical protein
MGRVQLLNDRSASANQNHSDQDDLQRADRDLRERARTPVYPTRIVRNNRTGKLEEMSMYPELPPIDEGDPGRT